MKIRSLLHFVLPVLGLILCSLHPLFSQKAVLVSAKSLNAAHSFQITDASNLQLIGSTNIANFSCDCEQNFEQQPLAFQALHGTEVVFINTDIKIKATLLDCGNKKMNRDMHETLNADQHPYITVQLKNVKQNEGYTISNCPDWVPMRATFALTLNGKTNIYTAAVKGKQLGSEKFAFKGKQSVCMSDFGITPPRPFMGLVTVDDEILLDFDLVVQTGFER